MLSKTDCICTQVLPLSQFLLLQTASPDAIIRLESTALEDKNDIREMYFKELHHQSIEDFLISELQRCGTKGGLLIQVTLIFLQYRVLHSLIFQVTTHSHLLTYDELEQVSTTIRMRVESCSLHEFETELDFTSKIG